MMANNKSKTNPGEQTPRPLTPPKQVDTWIEKFGCTQAQLTTLLRLIDKPPKVAKRLY